MKTKNENKIGIEGRPKYSNNLRFFTSSVDNRNKGDYQFVVPWQMLKTREKEMVIR